MWALEPAAHGTRSPSELQGERAFALIICLCSPQAWDPGSLFLCEDFNSLSSSLIPHFNFQVWRQRSPRSFHSELLPRVGCLRPPGPACPPPSCSLALFLPTPVYQPPLRAPLPFWKITFLELLISGCRPPPPHLPRAVGFSSAAGAAFFLAPLSGLTSRTPRGGVRGRCARLCTVFQFRCISSFALTGFTPALSPQVSAGGATADFRYFAVGLVGARRPGRRRRAAHGRLPYSPLVSPLLLQDLLCMSSVLVGARRFFRWKWWPL